VILHARRERRTVHAVTTDAVPTAVRELAQGAGAGPGVREVRLAGSAAAGDRTALSDWDYELVVDDDAALDRLERSVRARTTLGVFWDPLSERANLVVLLDGPTKVDLVVPERPSPVTIDAWEATAESLPQIDTHFWDWTLWLGAKHLRGRAELVTAELTKMHRALLAPLGVPAPPATIGEAVRSFVAARDSRAAELGVEIDDRLRRQVEGALAAHGVIAACDGLAGAIGYERRPANRFQRAVQAIASTRAGAWCFSKTIAPLDRLVHRLTGGRVTLPEVLAGLPVIMVTTTGRRSGQPRTSPLVGVPIGADLAIVGTNFGQRSTPAWVHNLASDPRARVAYRDRSVDARARPADDAERDEVLRVAATIYPGYDRYQQRITSRTIAILVLEPR
jgi:deazaflavin-dependent oxidoreductase (nitroreductase family)